MSNLEDVVDVMNGKVGKRLGSILHNARHEAGHQPAICSRQITPSVED